MTSTADRPAASSAKPRRTRMSPKARREQLIELGLTMTRECPIEEVSIDAIADAAGVSRALLFHYFDSKQDFVVALAQAQADQMLACTEPDPTLDDPIEMLEKAMGAFIDYVSANRIAYMAVIRGASSSDPAMRAVFDSPRAAMAERIFTHVPALGVEVTPIVRLAVHGWIAFVEETAINWFTTQDITRDELVALVTAALPALAAGAALTAT